MRTHEETATLIALLFKRSKQTRARLSTVTLRVLSKRRSIRRAFLTRVIDNLDDRGLILMEIDRGGYGLLSSSALDGATPVTAKKYLKDVLNEKKPVNFKDINKELEEDLGLDNEEE
jgi:hypothetical protein